MTTEQTTEQAAAPAPLNRAEMAEQVAFYRALAAEAARKADQYEARFETAIGDEYRRERTAPTWRVPGFGAISGRVKHAAMKVSNAGDFLAWFKAHRPDDVETVERVKSTVTSAVLKGCHVNDDGVIVTAGGDEIAGVEYVPGGAFEGVAFTFDRATKEAYAELARTAIDRLSLRPAEDEQPVPAAPYVPPAGAVEGDPWSTPAPDPWSTPAPGPWSTPATA